MRRRNFILFLIVILTAANAAAAQTAARSITVITEPQAIVWIDGIKRGATGGDGKLVVKPVAAGTHLLRVRADGFAEKTQPLAPAAKGEIKIALVKTTDAAELAFQEAERLKTRDRDKAVAAYQKAVGLRPKYAEAYLEMARVLSDKGDYEGALEAVRSARKARPVYPEATAVEGRIYRDSGDEEKAIAAFKSAIKEGKGFQPEAYTGLGLLYKEKANGAGGGGDYTDETALYDAAAEYLQKAIDQLSATEPAVYYLLGEVYEKQNKYDKAIKVYEQFLRDFPVSDDRTAIESFIVQAKKRLNGEQ